MCPVMKKKKKYSKKSRTNKGFALRVFLPLKKIKQHKFDFSALNVIQKSKVVTVSVMKNLFDPFLVYFSHLFIQVWCRK